MTDNPLSQTEIIEIMNQISLHQTDRLFPLSSADEKLLKIFGKFISVHPYTCGNNSNHTPLFPLHKNGEIFLICRDCDYTQKFFNWRT